MELPVLTTNLSGKVVIVTGTNTGIGLEAAKHFAKMNPARLICTSRSRDKCEATVRVIQHETGFTNIEGWELELSSFASVISFVQRFEQDGGPLDIVVANAAVAVFEFEQTLDGWENTLQVNHLSTALLSILLTPHLERTAKASSSTSRLVIVSSGAHSWSDFGEEAGFGEHVLENLNDKGFSKPDVMEMRYQHTKLLNVLFARALNDRLSPAAPIIVNLVNPGFCLSDLRRHVDRGQFDEYLYLKHARTSEEGSRQLIWAALAPQPFTAEAIDEYRGAYISNNGVRPPSQWVRSEEGRIVQDRIWEDTVAILSRVSPSVGSIVSQFVVN